MRRRDSRVRAALRRAPASLLAALSAVPACALLPRAALAHGEAHGPAGFDFWSEWSARPGVVIPILIGVAIYYTGIYRLWSRAGAGRGISRLRAASYTLGIATLIAALMSPLDSMSAALFSLHMVQHLLLILVAAPLLVLGAPEVALLWALPAASRRRAGRWENRVARSIAGPVEGGGKGPLLVVLLATGVLWVWHAPQLYDLAVRNDAVHTAEHAGFLITAVLFWATVLRIRERERLANGARVLYVFAMALQGSILGALITFASRPLYASHLEITREWGLEPIVDQQLAGLIMWVPPSLLYIGVTAWLLVGWLDAIGARRAARERRTGRERQAGEVAAPGPEPSLR
ncbi:MAG: cytochrome c oxidase assembly protein [Gammaproteobacteria bacterium]|nr:cytochrome c oxidase assembly protein [Gammaproteobacteria bacterium]